MRGVMGKRFSGNVQIGLSREAPAMFKHGDIYLMVTSGCTGWLANRAEVFYARQAASLVTHHCTAYILCVLSSPLVPFVHV